MRWRLLVCPCRFAVSLACASLALGAAHAGPAVAQPPAPVASTAATAAKPAPAGPLWHELTAQQRQILAPVINEWNGFSKHKKQRLINIAKRYPDMSPDEQAKIQARLPHWLELPQTSRDEARVNMKKLLQLPPDERKRTEEKLRAKLTPPPTVAPLAATPVTPAPASTPATPAALVSSPPVTSPAEAAKPLQ
jgi:hypothetical protein